ncbi:CPBP family intramembrane glutamic endopeptidase [Nocardiopsis sp. Huas11]|uniref:CPBP family intramembrane glutamic endopeptidase n=1 Tax=Nocardiopsis sp. Huas11 TaxID=2183912 RepID=UPI0018F7672C|nr:CPBP family intramembrane glutamic endopeptidase [Nocardiopsis sp. Huas11]
MPWSETLPQFSLVGTLLTVLLLLFAAFGEPLLGRFAFARLARDRHDGGRTLRRLYAVTMAIHALWGLLVLAVLVLSPGLGAGDLGLRVPGAWGPIAGGAVGGLLALAVLWILTNGLPFGRSGSGRKGGRRGSGHRGNRASAAPAALPEPGRHPQSLLVPRTTAERVLAGGAAVTGGVFGELLYRGLFITLLAAMGVPLWIAAVLSVLLFSVAHVYQGWWGLVSAGASGALFTILYLGTGSLWVPMAVHVALNLRSLVFPPASARDDAGDGYEDGYEDDDEPYDERPYDDQSYDDQGPGLQPHGDGSQGQHPYGDPGQGRQPYEQQPYQQPHEQQPYGDPGQGRQPWGAPAPPPPYEERYADRPADPNPYPPGPASPYEQRPYGEQYEQSHRDHP